MDWARSRGHRTAFTKVYESEALPENADGIDFLIVMGGPQSPDEDRQAFPYYDPEAELHLMRQAVAADKYIIGVYLGTQLLSVAYGARHERSFDEAGDDAELGLSVQHALLRHGDVEAFAGAGDGDVHETAFFFEAAAFGKAHFAGEAAFLQMGRVRQIV